MVHQFEEQSAEVSLGGVVHETAMPFPWVEYPGHYGTFFRFSREENDSFVFCSCSEQALRNLAEIRLRFPPPNNVNHARMALLGSLYVPERAALETVDWSIDDLEQIEYENAVCHMCNQTPPTLKWCHPMYGSTWKQSFGWFSYFFAFKGGVNPWHIEQYLEDICPSSIIPDVEEYSYYAEDIKKYLFDPVRREIDPGLRDPEFIKLKKKAQTLKSRVMRYFSNQARKSFGFKRLGEEWISETLLYKIVQSLLPHKRLIRHFRADWLHGLELDIYIPELNVGIEYQGIQHSCPVSHWGGKESLKKQRTRDEKKRNYCKRKNCKLIEIWHTTEINFHSIEQILSKHKVL